MKAAFLFFLWFATSEALGRTSLGQASDWEAHKYFEQDVRGKRTPLCVLTTTAILSQPKNLSEARKPRAYLSRRPKAGGWYYEIAIKTGAALLPDRTPKLQIGDKAFFLFAGATRSNREAEWAWVRKEDVSRVFSLMRFGANMELTAQIEDELEIRDRFSLFGVSKGIALINEGCAK